jgi:hypothetical protein
MTKLTKELETLLGDYWELAYEEGRLRISNGDKANEVLHKIRCAIEAEKSDADEFEQAATNFMHANEALHKYIATLKAALREAKIVVFCSNHVMARATYELINKALGEQEATNE